VGIRRVAYETIAFFGGNLLQREFFEAAHQRDGSGCYMVRLPAKEEVLPDLNELR